MENTNAKADSNNSSTRTDAEENPNVNNNNNQSDGDDTGNRRQRTPFTDLSQVDADLALARTLQEQYFYSYRDGIVLIIYLLYIVGIKFVIRKQERAYMMLRMDGGGSDYGSWGAGSYEHDWEVGDDEYESEVDYDESDVEVDDDSEDVFDEHARAEGVENDDQNVELDPSAFSSDEAYARALQDAEEREMATRLLALAGLNESSKDLTVIVGEDEDEEEHGDDSQDVWAEVDPDELSYEELVALGEVVGTESRGLSAETIASLPSINYNSEDMKEGNSDSCVICRLDYEDDDTLTVLSCKHSYHSECINNWLHINKVSYR
ncbi:hypothetical protein RD792_015229 [Penstemon davidsonii]|uniref:RING-type domain-containing protein n=1 Tax=Penstemon davidsonii TaxID=160366 RepID=A0ABR0CT15_9LAMI|nr:hypothetical protein RD792_015229 [Penstemon davidsonii]